MRHAFALVVMIPAALVAGEIRRELPNPLGQWWPWELVSLDFPAEQAESLQTVTLAGERRPVQVEMVAAGQAQIARAWFMATIAGSTVEEGGKRVAKSPPASLTAVFAPGKAESPVAVERVGGHVLIRTGVYELRLRDYPGKLAKPLPLEKLDHWLAGMRLGADAPWDGRAWFDGKAEVAAVHTRILAQGPVYVDVSITYEFVGAEPDGTVEALPLESGKRCHLWEPDRPPRVQVPKRARFYEVLVRCADRDPWIEVHERAALPGDDKDQDRYRYWVHWGKPAEPMARFADLPMAGFMPVDTVLWLRWFEYDRFGGNDKVLTFPAEPRPEQKERPFANLSPRWDQGGAGSQDIYFTSGGTDKDSGDRPCVGVVTAYASKWVAPYRQEIKAQVKDRERAWCEFPLADGAGSGLYYGQRCYAFVLGRRGGVNPNDLVRRHTDWTLTALLNRYRLTWERDPAKAGPHIALARERLNALRRDLAAGADNSTVAFLRQAQAERERIKADIEAAGAEEKAAGEAQLQAKAEKEKAMILQRLAEARARGQGLKKRLEHDGWKLLDLLLGKEAAQKPGLPGPGLWLGRRYQDDFLNPTSHPVRHMKGGFSAADLWCDGQPIGDGNQAAVAYIFSDLDQWPGWHQGWHPGNPNFHTDKYQTTVYAAAALLDHPHAKDWLAYGLSNFRADMATVLTAPDGAGYECPGYSSYSLNHQLALARVLLNCGAGNLVAADPLFKATGTWHRKLLTPRDPRLGCRHEAPIGDTHRWNAGLGDGFADLAAFYQDSDPAFLRTMLTARELACGEDRRPTEERIGRALVLDPGLRPAKAEDLDWTSQAFAGFGAILRSRFATGRETFVAFKAGETRGHYHNDEASFHLYAEGAPLALDYNCSYHPRGDHAALHNSLTFGVEGTVPHNARDETVPAMEQVYGTARMGAFATTPEADALVCERVTNRLVLSPVDPHDAEFSRQYPSRLTFDLVHRRFLVLVKHPADSAWSDYLVVRDETRSTVPQQVNLHLLARQAVIDGSQVRATGQWGVDALLAVVQASDLRIERRRWYFAYDETGNVTVERLPGENDADYQKRCKQLWEQKLATTDGRCLIPPEGHVGTWMHGEYQIWLRLHTRPGTPVTWVLYPYRAGTQAPAVEGLAEGRGVRLSLAGETETVWLASMPAEGLEAQAALERSGTRMILLPASAVPVELGAIGKGKQ